MNPKIYASSLQSPALTRRGFFYSNACKWEKTNADNCDNNNNVMKKSPFKTCPCCGHEWPAMEAFLEDPTLRMDGYQTHLEDLTGGLFVFTHHTPECGTTLAVEVKQFLPLSNHPILSAEAAQPAANCPQHCMREGCLEPCPEECECNWVREVLKKISEWQKKTP